MPDTVYSALQRIALAQGARPAITFIEIADLDLEGADSDSLSYSALFRNVVSAANAFRALSGKQAPVVSLLAPSTIHGLTALLAAQVAGIANPINYFMDAAQISAALTAAGTDILVAQGPHPTIDIWRKVEAIRGSHPALKAIILLGHSSAPDALTLRQAGQGMVDSALVGALPEASDTAAYFNTAGTTGSPKIVRLSHTNILASANSLAHAWAYSPQTRIVNALPFFHVAGANLLGLAPLLYGAEVLLPTETGLRNPAVVARHWEMVARYQPSIIGGIPSSLASLLDVPLNGADISCVQFCATGGAPLPETLANEFEKRFRKPIRGIYGMTETAGLIATTPVSAVPDYRRAGFPVSGIQVEVRPLTQDGVLAHALKDGETGALVIRGAAVFSGYLKAEDTAAAFTKDGWLITGDIGSIAHDGSVNISGRAKDVIIRSGHNIDPSTIETCANLHPSVAASAAVAMPDAYAGEVPALYIVAKEGHRPNVDELATYIRGVIPEPQAQPASIFVIDALPLTPLGKVSKLKLRADSARRAAEASLASLDNGARTYEVAIVEGAGGQLHVLLSLGDQPDKTSHVSPEAAMKAIGLLGMKCVFGASTEHA